ncbi:transposase [Tistrella mobilis]
MPSCPPPQRSKNGRPPALSDQIHWPRVEILVRADSHYAAPQVFDLCRFSGVNFILGLAIDATLRARVAPLEANTRARTTDRTRSGASPNSMTPPASSR